MDILFFMFLAAGATGVSLAMLAIWAPRPTRFVGSLASPQFCSCPRFTSIHRVAFKAQTSSF